MRRIVAIVSIAVLAVGCHAPSPSMNVLAPYGSATVPAPATGSVGTSGNYYAPPQAGGGAAPAAAPAPAGSPPGAFIGAADPNSSMTDSAVVPASYTPGTTGRSSLPSSSGSSSSSGLKINGMPVNDATALPEPGEPVNLTQLPDASQSPTLLRVAAPGSLSSAGLPSPAGLPSGGSQARGNWQTR